MRIQLSDHFTYRRLLHFVPPSGCSPFYKRTVFGYPSP